MSFRRRFPRSTSTPELALDMFLLVPIGKGSYGTVYKGVHKLNMQTYAIKEIKKKNHQRLIHYELQIMYSFECPHIVRLYDHFETESSVYLLLEFVEGKQLFEGVINKNNKLQFRETARMVHELCSAVEYIHSRGVIHRDIKPENIMLDKDGKVKLSDFGAANYILQDQSRKTFIGTPQYMAPELLYENEQSTAVDIWAIGVIIFELTTKKLPFTAKTTPKIYENIKNIKYEIPVCIEREQDLKHLLRSIFVVQPQNRPNIRQVSNHPWILKNMQTDSIINILQIPETDNTKSAWKEQRLCILNRVNQLQESLEQKQCARDHQFQKYRLQVQRRITTANGMAQRKENIIVANQAHLTELRKDIQSYLEVKREYDCARKEIEQGNQSYLSILEERKKLKIRQLKLQEQMNIHSVLQRKSSANSKASKDKVIVEMPTTATLTSTSLKSEEDEHSYKPPRHPGVLQKSLSFSITQIQDFLAELREKKHMTVSTSSSGHLLS